MELEKLIKSLTPEIYQNLRSAVALGRWPDGRTVSKEQREYSMQAIIYYEEMHNVPETERVGYMEQRCKSQQRKEVEHKGYELKL